MIQMHHVAAGWSSGDRSCTMGGMEMSEAHALNRVILSLYHEGREVPLGSFQAWALGQLQWRPAACGKRLSAEEVVPRSGVR